MQSNVEEGGNFGLKLRNSTIFSIFFLSSEVGCDKEIKGQVSKETVVLRRWEYYKIIWFYQLG